MSVSIPTDSPAFFQARKGPAVPTHPMAAPSSSHCGWWEREREREKGQSGGGPRINLFFPPLLSRKKRRGKRKERGRKREKKTRKSLVEGRER